MKENFPSMNFSLSKRAEYCIFVEKNQCMRNVLELKIEEWWAVLAPDTSISIEMTSPLWHDSGTFSYTFQLPYYANRHIFNASDKPESDVNLKTFRKRFGLYLYGVGFLFGDIVCTSDEIDTDNDRVDVEIRSANATFEDAIDGKSLRDLDLGDVSIGELRRRNREFVPNPLPVPYSGGFKYIYADKYTTAPGAGIEDIYYTRHNGSTIYPAEPYINIPIIVKEKEDDDKETKEGEETPLPILLSSYRAFSSPCFFVSYVIKTIFAQFKYRVGLNDMDDIEDLKRLILLNTKFSYNAKEMKREEVKSGVHNLYYNYITGEPEDPGLSVPVYPITSEPWPWREFNIEYDLTASSENLPDIGIAEFLNSFKNAFGMVLQFDDTTRGVKVQLLKNIFRSKEIKKMGFKEVLSVQRIHQTFGGIELKYEESEGEEFSYNAYNAVSLYDNYEVLFSEWNNLKKRGSVDPHTGLTALEADITLKIDKETGNFYRTKVDKDTFTDAQLFEVGQFLPYKVDGNNLEEKPEEKTISFTPIIPTSLNDTNSYRRYTERPLPTEALFVDTGITCKGDLDYWLELKDAADGVSTLCYSGALEHLKDLLDFDCGFTVGVVRTSPEGSLAENYTVVTTNVDGFGNDEWVRTLSTTTVTNDSVSREGYLFDYNGTDEGIGAPMDQLVSLKLWNGKQNFDPSTLSSVDESGNTITGKDVYNNNPTGPLPNRGLVPQFLSELLHFMKHRKPISVVGNIHVSELLNVEWDKYHDVAGYRGLLDKIKFTVSMEGMSEVTVDHFII